MKINTDAEADKLIATLNPQQSLAYNYITQEVKRLSLPLQAASGKTIQQIFDTLSEDQEDAIYFKFTKIIDGAD